jgi:hypothetical protein
MHATPFVLGCVCVLLRYIHVGVYVSMCLCVRLRVRVCECVRPLIFTTGALCELYGARMEHVRLGNCGA